MAPNSFAQRYFELTNQDPYIQSVARPGQTITKKMPYEYGVIIGGQTVNGVVQPLLTLAAGAITSTLATLADSDFVLSAISASVNINANSDMKFNRNLTLQIQDASTGKYFYSAPTVMALSAGGGGFPLVYAAPRVLRPNTILNVTAQNRDTGQDYQSMYITFHGTRIFYADQAQAA